jgi:TPR repeat protein
MAQEALGGFYKTGKGVIQSSREAAQWYRKAAQQGSSMAQFNLGAFYQAGEGVPQDFIESYFWLKIADAGTTMLDGPDQKEMIERYLDSVGRKLTAAGLSQAEGRVRAWLATHPGNHHSQ